MRKKEFKPPRQVTFILQKRQERVRKQVKQMVEEHKKQRQLSETGENKTESQITITTNQKPETVTIDDDEDIMIID